MIFPFDLLGWLFDSGQKLSGGIGNFLSDVGGKIAAGMEAGIIAIIKDLWDATRPFIYLALGFLIILWAFAYIFKVNPLQLAMMAVK